MKRILPGVLMFLSASLLLLAPERSADAISKGLRVCAGSICRSCSHSLYGVSFGCKWALPKTFAAFSDL